MGTRRGFKANRARSLAEIAANAEAARHALARGLGPGAAFPIEDVLPTLREVAVEEALRFKLDAFCGEHLPATIWASSWFDETSASMTICLCPVAWSELLEGVPRSRFSAAHELGHIYLHHAELREHARLTHAVEAERGTLDHAREWDTESQANMWAGQLLVPNAGLRLLAAEGPLVIDRIAQRFRVSELAARIRIEEFGL